MTSIQAIFIAQDAGLPLVHRSKVNIIANQGVQGDRYALSKGVYSHARPSKVRDVTFIARMGIDRANHLLNLSGHQTFSDVETRRNIVLKEITPEELNDLVGKTFSVGGIEFYGTELCIPCERPSKLANKKHFFEAFEGNGGIRARALSSGEIALHDLLKLLD